MSEETEAIAPSPKKAKHEEVEAVQRAHESVVAQQKNQPRKTSVATVGEDSSAPAAAPRPRFPPYPTSGKIKDLRKWDRECSKINRMLKKDLDYNIPIPTMRKPKDPCTTAAVQSSRDKELVRLAARSIVSVSHIMQDGERQPQCTGIIKHWAGDTPAHHHAIVVTYSGVACEAGRKLDPLPKLSVTLPDKKTVLDVELIYFSDHYNIALLRISLDYKLELHSTVFGPGPEYGQGVFVLARDGQTSLRVSRGNVEWLEESDILGRDYYMFLSCYLPEGGTGGMVTDHNGDVRGIAVYWNPDPAVISISTIVTCVGMFMQFNRVARVVLGISIRTIAMLDVQLQEDISDMGIKSGYIVDNVQYNSDGKKQGIKRGNVITSINGQYTLTLPRLEDYLLSLGWAYLRDKSICMKNLKLIVCDLSSGVKREVTLSAKFSDKSEADDVQL